MIQLDEFQKELTTLINKHSIDNESNTPDFVLAEYLTDSIMAYRSAKSRADNLKVGGPFERAGKPIECGCYKCLQNGPINITIHRYDPSPL